MSCLSASAARELLTHLPTLFASVATLIVAIATLIRTIQLHGRINGTLGRLVELLPDPAAADSRSTPNPPPPL